MKSNNNILRKVFTKTKKFVYLFGMYIGSIIAVAVIGGIALLIELYQDD